MVNKMAQSRHSLMWVVKAHGSPRLHAGSVVVVGSILYVGCVVVVGFILYVGCVVVVVGSILYVGCVVVVVLL